MRMKKVLLGGVPGLAIVGVTALIAYTSNESQTMLPLLPLIIVGFCVCYAGMIVQNVRYRRHEKAAAEAEQRAGAQAAAQEKKEVEELLGKYAKK